MKVFCYIRPESNELYRNIVPEIFRNADVIYYSDYRGLGELWAGDFLYNEKYDSNNAEFDRCSGDIIARCRILRRLQYNEAYRRARRYWNGIDELFSRYQFDVVMMHPIDTYPLDIIERIAMKYGILTVAVVGTIFSNHVMITTRGEYRSVGRIVSDEEVKTWIHKFLDDRFLPDSETNNVKKNHKSIYKFYFRRKLVEDLYYPLRKVLSKDPWNYQYNMLNLKGKRFSEFYTKDIDFIFQRLKDISFDPSTSVYLPLHFVPEASTDYWCSNVKEANYNQFIIDLISQTDKTITFIVKEHPAMYGKRPLSFYTQLNNMNNVILVHPMDRSNELLKKIETLVIDTGTVGVEALMRGKRVLTISHNYYSDFHPNAISVDSIKREYLQKPIVDYPNELFMRKLLEGVFESDFSNSRDGAPKSNPKQLIDGIRTYLKYIGFIKNDNERI